ncbi:MAG: aldehyde dehydrogenase family protein [Candidatus Acetothermia bacterium]|jgi:acyl-CoA reductase-like NAD-dependent aldehyde dehydrogenase|nr:aldehyde dehydrogenase family protein [Candidatus Acetothermia bacterium]MDH7505044.1 aldehyde dehydrogenase family protein [Candidatus Acetothermia bacterium]
MVELGLLIGGEWVETAKKLEVRNPYNHELLAEVPQAGEAEVERALAAAQEAFTSYRKSPAHARAALLRRAAALLEKWKEEFARTIALEAAKPWRYALAEAERAVETLSFSAGEAERLHGETVPMDAARGSEHRRGLFIRQPVGVIVAISPFNFPLNLVAHKVGPALAAGNTVILKPASATPLTALKLGELFLEAGLPPGALNILVGPGRTVGERLIRDKRVRMVTFTGSAPVGERLKRESGIKKLTLELGSNSGAIIAEDADLEQALAKCLVGGFAYSGQVCIHTQRIYIHESLKERFTAEFVSRAARLRRGDPLDPATELGPLIDEPAAIKAESWIKEAISQGARLLCGGRREGNFLEPTVLTEVRPEMKVVCEETFAPIVVIDSFADFEEAIEKFNEGSRLGSYDYGLACGVFTRDLKRAWRAIEELEVGNVFINDSATFRADQMPYGGVKESGLGREGPHFALEEMTEIKMVSFSL